jgi:transposase
MKRQSKEQVRPLIVELLARIEALKTSGFVMMRSLGNTLDDWLEEIARMWRFTKSNGITEGFHRKMKLIQRRAYGFKNFENYRLRVKILCG